MGMADSFATRAEDMVKVDQKVDIWVYRITEHGKLGLSMVEYGQSDLKDPVSFFRTVDSSDWFSGQVRFTHSFGAYVDVDVPSHGGRVQGHVPKRLIRGELRQGDVVKVRVLKVLEGSGTLE